LSNSDFNTGPKNGPAKVYHKNLVKVLKDLKEADSIINASSIQSLLIQAHDCLVKLKKADPDYMCHELENEYSYYKDQFLKQKLNK